MKNKILTGILTAMLLSTSGVGASMYIKADNLEAIIEKQEVDSKKKSTEIANLKETVENKDFDLEAKNMVIEGKNAEIKTLKLENQKLKSENKKVKSENKTLKKKIESVNTTSNKKYNNTSSKVIKSMSVNASAYIALCREGCSGKTRTGYDVRNTIYYNGMRIIATDTSVIPMYSIVKIEGFSEKFIVLDTGGYIKGNKIDVLVKSESEAVKFGRKNLKLDIIRYGRG